MVLSISVSGWGFFPRLLNDSSRGIELRLYARTPCHYERRIVSTLSRPTLARIPGARFCHDLLGLGKHLPRQSHRHRNHASVPDAWTEVSNRGKPAHDWTYPQRELLAHLASMEG